MKIQSVAILGAGAVGCYVLWGLADKAAANSLQLGVVAEGSRAERLRQNGCTINGQVYHPQVWTPQQAHGVDLLIVAPCTGNTLGKLANGIADSPVSFACKAHLRNGRPVLLAVSTNDGLSGSAANLGALLARRHFYFVPFGQDSPTGKPASLVAHFSLLPEAAEAALRGEQLQPLLV